MDRADASFGGPFSRRVPPMTDEQLSPRHTVAVIGAAVAGAQVARMLADRGASVVVFEQNERPFGKIEDGLPRWHSALRKKEFSRITELLEHPNIYYLPKTKVGDDIGFSELVKDWGFSSVVLANGVWRDRPLPIPDADRFLGKGLVYQNPFIVAFNHAEDPNYHGPRFDIPDGALVVGGGLASIDVAKVLMLENTRRKLAERGHEVDLEELEKTGIPKMCESLGIPFEELGLKGATLIYRRRAEDMPVAEGPADGDPARLKKAQASRLKILERAMSKFCFRFEPLASPEAPITDGDRLVGLVLRRMATTDGKKLTPTDETFELRGSCVISSIGSIPEPIAGIAMKGELFAFTDWDLGRLEGLPTVFSAGNVVTGKGNIVASRKHSTHIGEHVAGVYLGLKEPGDVDLADALHDKMSEKAAAVAEKVSQVEPVRAETLAGMLARVQARQQKVGFAGDVAAWIKTHPPAY